MSTKNTSTNDESKEYTMLMAYAHELAENLEFAAESLKHTWNSPDGALVQQILREFYAKYPKQSAAEHKT